MDLINCINIELDLDMPENEARSASQSLCDGQVLPALDRVMRRFENEDIVIEQPLVIELGEVPEGQLSYSIEDAFYRALAKYRHETNVTLEAVYANAVPKSPSDVFLDYLQFPVLPWDADGVTQFDGSVMMREMAQKALSSETYMERLASLVKGNVETCKRFFDLPWPKEELLSILGHLIPGIPALQAEIYGRLLHLLGDDNSVKSSVVREVFYYILSGVLFGNGRDAVNREMVVALLLVGKERGGISVVRLAQLFGQRTQVEGRAVHLPERAVHSTTANGSFIVPVESSEVKSVSSFEKAVHPTTANESLAVPVESSEMESVSSSEEAMHPTTANESLAVPVESSEMETVSPSEKNAHHAEKKDSFAEPVEDLETRHAPEIERAIAESRSALKQELTHDEAMRRLLLRLIQLINMVLKGEASFSQHVAEMERILEMLWDGTSKELREEDSLVFDSSKTISAELAEEVSDIMSSAATNAKNVRLSEEEVIDIMALLSVLHDKEMNTEVAKSDKVGIKEVVSAIIRKQPTLDKRIPVHNAGLVLFQPFLTSFFDRLGLLESRKSFKSLESQLRAAHLLHELSGFEGEHLEHLLPLNKLLCGINIMFPIGTTFDVTEEEKRETDALLKAVIRNWSAIGKVSPAGFQEAFVRRDGLLERSQDEWILRVESKGIDVLLDYIPWDIHTVSLPWNEYLIFVDWKV